MVATRSDIVALFNKRRQALIEEMNSGTFNVALTSDIWSGRVKEDYLSIVIHYTDSDWVIQKRIIGFRLVDTSHTSTAICECILNVLVDYVLTERVIEVTLDNAAANSLAIDFLRPLVKGFHEELFHQQCACHIINLIVKSGLKRIQEPIQKIRDSIKYLNAKNSRIQSWGQTCKHNCVPPCRLPVDVETRWNSTYLMLDKVIQYKKLFTMWINN